MCLKTEFYRVSVVNKLRKFETFFVTLSGLRVLMLFLQIVWIPNILVSYLDHGRNSDRNMLVMNNT